MAKGFYVQEGKTIDYMNNGDADIAYCDVVPLVSRVGVAACDIPKGGKGSLSISGVYELPADTAAMTVGQLVQWDTAAGKVVAEAGAAAAAAAAAAEAEEDEELTDTAKGAGTVPCGTIVADKAEGSVVALVKI